MIPSPSSTDLATRPNNEERRAQAVKLYLEGLGVSSSQLSIISYGEEQPLDSGHSESSWWKNRRSEFKIQ